MTTKNIFKIHPFFYILTSACVITGHFKDFSLFMILVFFHELGHVLTALHFKWNIDKIVILPFGCLTIFKTKISNPFIQEFFVSIMGVIFQTMLFVILKNFNITNLYSIHYSILIFNLLPIFPLDGFKILNCLLNIFLPFKKSYYISLIISFLLVFILIIKFNLILYLILFFLFVRIISEYKNIKYLFNKFLYERKTFDFNFKMIKIIINVNNMYKYYKNIFYKDGLYYTEKQSIDNKLYKM